MNQVPATSNDFLGKMTSDVNVGINEVVSVFVAKYEDNLFTEKDRLSAAIKRVKKDMEELAGKLKASVNKSQYETSIAVLNMYSKVDSVDVYWEKQYCREPNTIVVHVGLYDNDVSRKHAEHTKEIVVRISENDVEQHDDLKKELEGLNAELIEVMSKIKNVSRKERQIRGKISEMKLEQSGYTGLMENAEMLKLVQLDQ